MKKSYLFVYDNEVGTRDQVKAWLDSMDEVLDWRYEIPNSFYLISEKSAKELSEHFHQVSGQRKNVGFIITEIVDNSFGWLDGKSWYLIQNKVRKPK
jgi:hypothetical protein